ncbi:MAG: cadmium-translocating P-type ATPase [Clostridiaceae bacterium]|jgi:Cd2+/Zn2+-exporting ATPase|nr:heavy metal translocating P-type ATPase [Bacillota bacterium]NLN52453.1 cadmium-translocating P-type ATPase [Clostridiaceae bacterium]
MTKIKNLSKSEQRLLLRILISVLIFTILLPFYYSKSIDRSLNWTIFNREGSNYLFLILFLIAYLIIGYDIIRTAFLNISSGTVFDENFLMSIATIGAFLIGEYPEGIAVMLFYQVGEFSQRYAVNKSRKSIAELMDIAPDYANIIENGELSQVDPYEIGIDDEIIILPGERIPLDGTVLAGNSALDTSALTGESMPQDVGPGDQVISGCINLSGKLTVLVSKEFDDSTVAKILELVENASDQKAKSEVFATTFARYYTPIVVFAALSVALLPPLLFSQSLRIWLERALVFLVVSCPCALVVSVPLTFFGGIGAASKSGILVKGSNYLEYLARTTKIIFDKTGTLTEGNFGVSKIYSPKIPEHDLLEIAAYSEYFSNHPIAKSIVDAYGKEINPDLIEDIQEISGHGIQAIIKGKTVLAGNLNLMRNHDVEILANHESGTLVHFAVDQEYMGYILLEDQIKADAKQAIHDLHQIGISEISMLTGDQEKTAAKISQVLGLDDYHSELLPADKVYQLEKSLNDKTSGQELIAYVGDGINDAPVLARADLGIAMGGMGSDAAIEAADVVIMNDQPSRIVKAIRIGRKTLNIVKQNVTFALLVKFAILLLAVFGIANMWLAVFGDVGVTIIAVFNAMRALKN